MSDARPLPRVRGRRTARRPTGLAVVFIAFLLSSCSSGRPLAGGMAIRSAIFVASADDTIRVLDPSTLRTRESLSLGSGAPGEKMPHKLALAPDGRTLLVTEYAWGALGLYDLRARRLLAEVPVGRGPHGLVLSPDGRFAYVAASQSKVVSVVDIGSRRLVAQIPTHLLPWDLTLARDGRTAWVTSLGAETLARVDLVRRRSLGVVRLGEPWVVAATVLPDGRVVAGGHSSNRLFVFDAEGRTVLARPTVGSLASQFSGATGRAPAVGLYCQIQFSGGTMPVAFALRSDPAGLVALNHGTDDLVVLDLPGLGVTQRIKVGRDPQDIALSPDGRFAYVSAGASGELWKVDLRTGQRRARARVGQRPIGVLLSRSPSPEGASAL
ncbi:MAG: hypothetical protein HY775_00755 [Acidobacteria bacterium]|nr:hypothetical protein [Acidobacteriota bacterium]